jgi:hypothetical protein
MQVFSFLPIVVKYAQLTDSSSEQQENAGELLAFILI